jgi:hypothetical protein
MILTEIKVETSSSSAAIRVIGRYAVDTIGIPKREVIVERAHSSRMSMRSDRKGGHQVYIALGLHLPRGTRRLRHVLRRRTFATGTPDNIGEASASSRTGHSAEPGTQYMRTFHTGGVASADDFTQGLRALRNSSKRVAEGIGHQRDQRRDSHRRQQKRARRLSPYEDGDAERYLIRLAATQGCGLQRGRGGRRAHRSSVTRTIPQVQGC